MGESKRKMAMMRQNGHILQQARVKPVRVVADLRMENREGVTFLMIGETQPELAIALNSDQCRFLAAKLVDHADALEAVQQQTPPDDQPPTDRLIVLPGE